MSEGCRAEAQRAKADWFPQEARLQAIENLARSSVLRKRPASKSPAWERPKCARPGNFRFVQLSDIADHSAGFVDCGDCLFETSEKFSVRAHSSSGNKDRHKERESPGSKFFAIISNKNFLAATSPASKLT